MYENSDSTLSMGFIPVLFMSLCLATVAHFLAKDKGRKVALWTVLGAIPVINIFFLWFFVGAANLRLERKIDELLAAVKNADKERD